MPLSDDEKYIDEIKPQAALSQTTSTPPHVEGDEEHEEEIRRNSPS